MADRFEQWSRAKLGMYELDADTGEYWVSVLVPVDGKHHDPRADVVDVLSGLRPSDVHHAADDADAEKLDAGKRHRKTKGKAT